MKKITILLLVSAILGLIPYQAFAKPRTFITFSDFMNNKKYTLYEIKASGAQSKVEIYESNQKNTSPKPSRNIFAKTSKRR